VLLYGPILPSKTLIKIYTTLQPSPPGLRNQGKNSRKRCKNQNVNQSKQVRAEPFENTKKPPDFESLMKSLTPLEKSRAREMYATMEKIASLEKQVAMLKAEMGEDVLQKAQALTSPSTPLRKKPRQRFNPKGVEGAVSPIIASCRDVDQLKQSPIPQHLLPKQPSSKQRVNSSSPKKRWCQNHDFQLSLKSCK